jgi:hypothetical protein
MPASTAKSPIHETVIKWNTHSSNQIAADIAMKYMPKNVNLKIGSKTCSQNNRNNYAIGSKLYNL